MGFHNGHFRCFDSLVQHAVGEWTYDQMYGRIEVLLVLKKEVTEDRHRYFDVDNF